MSTTIRTPVAGYTGRAYIGGLVLDFDEGTATVDGDLPGGVAVYLAENGYGIDGAPKEPAPTPEPADPREHALTQVGTRLRDAAVDPRPGDFLPPTNAGDANPHGPDVVAPGIHAMESKAIVPGEVGDVARQEERETELAERTLAADESVPAVTADLAEPGAVQTADGVVHVGVVPASAELTRPQKNDKTEAWRDYAVTSGALTRDEADKLGRDAIIERIGA